MSQKYRVFPYKSKPDFISKLYNEDILAEISTVTCAKCDTLLEGQSNSVSDTVCAVSYSPDSGASRSVLCGNDSRTFKDVLTSRLKKSKKISISYLHCCLHRKDV